MYFLYVVVAGEEFLELPFLNNSKTQETYWSINRFACLTQSRAYLSG